MIIVPGTASVAVDPRACADITQASERASARMPPK